MNSSIFSLNWKDVGKSLLLFFLTTFVASIYTAVEGGHFPTGPELVASLKAAAIATVAYLIKNFLTNSKDQPLSSEQKSGGQTPYAARRNL